MKQRDARQSSSSRSIGKDARRRAVETIDEALRQAKEEPVTKPMRDFDLD